MVKSPRFPLTPQKAANIKWLARHENLSQTAMAILLELNVGQVSHVINGHRFPEVTPAPPPGFG